MSIQIESKFFRSNNDNYDESHNCKCKTSTNEEGQESIVKDRDSINTDAFKRDADRKALFFHKRQGIQPYFSKVRGRIITNSGLRCPNAMQFDSLHLLQRKNLHSTLYSFFNGCTHEILYTIQHPCATTLEPVPSFRLPTEMKRLTLPWNKPVLLGTQAAFAASTTRNPWFAGTICLRPRRRPPAARDHSHGTTLGMFFPCACVPPPMLCPSVVSAFRRCVPSACNGETTVASMANWLPPNNVKPSAITSKRRASLLWESVMSRSRSTTFGLRPTLAILN